MNIAVRYYSRGGNTKKIAEAIAGAVGVEAKTVSEPLKEAVDILFLGSAPYAFDVDDEVKKFISGIRVSVGKVVNFSTSAAVRSTQVRGKAACGKENSGREGGVLLPGRVWDAAQGQAERKRPKGGRRICEGHYIIRRSKDNGRFIRPLKA